MASSYAENAKIESIVQRLLGQTKPGVLIDLEEEAARRVFLSQPMLLRLTVPPGNKLKFVGDIHGQYHDLKRILDICGYPPDENYLFLGDYVDRGRQSLEVICLLICFKVLFPDNFFILRGNHEVSSINRQYGFYDECRRRYSVKLWKSFSDVFGTLPLAALVEGRIFCMHGGIPNISHHPRFRMEDIDRIARPLPEIAIDLSEIPPIETDLLWADPVPPLDPQRPSVKLDQDGYSFNAVRSVSHFFGRVVLQEFLEKFHLDLIVRAHEVVQDGYAFFGSKTRSKMCLTLFGAPNYTGEFDNAAAVMTLTSDLEASITVLAPPSQRKTHSEQTNGEMDILRNQSS